ncbi:MAG: histidine kinase [Chitinophagales bacterium]|jgi:two-component sensor histidine kinase
MSIQSDLIELSQAIFNDRKKAQTLLHGLSGQITQKSPQGIKAAYYHAASFIANQSYQYDQALDYLHAARPAFERISNPIALANIWLDCSAVLTNQRKWKEAQAAIDKARRYLKNSEQPHLFAHLLAREGVLHLRLRNFGQALELLVESNARLMALKRSADLKDRHIHTLVLSSLGELYELRGLREQSIDAYTRVLPIVEEYRLWPRSAWHYLNAARVSMALNDLEGAGRFLDQSLQRCDPTDQEVKANVLTNQGIIAMLTNHPELARSKFEAGEALLAKPKKPTDYDNLAKAEWWYAELSRLTNDLESQENHLLNAFEIGEYGTDLNQQRRTAMALSVMYQRSNALVQALEWQQRATELTEKYYIELRKTERQELDARYELERIRQEAQMARLRVSGLQSKALRAQMNPHFLFNALNAIQGFITSGRGTEAATYLARFAKFMRQTLEYSDLEEVSLDDEINFIEKYLEINRKLRFRDKLNYLVRAPLEAEPSELMIPAMIIQPFVENAIEHGLRPKQEGFLSVSFELSEDEKHLICVIEDDGVGVKKGKEKIAAHGSEHQTHRSRGLDITKERLALLHGIPNGHFVTITDRSDLPPFTETGTKVLVEIPLLRE